MQCEGSARQLEKIYEDKSFKCILEWSMDQVFLHAEVTGALLPSDVRRGRAVFAQIKDDVRKMGHRLLFAVSPTPHFIRLICPGFIVIPEQTTNEKGMELVVWELK